MEELRSGFVLACIAQALALAALLWGTRERAGGRWLAAALAVLAGMLVVYPLGWQGRAEVPVWLMFLPLNLPLALGPSLYMYVCRISALPLPARAWLHFVPAGLHLAYLATLSLMPFAIAYGWKEHVHDDIVKPLVEVAVLISLATYGMAGLARIRDFRARLGACRSDADVHDARWLARLLWTLLASFAVLAAVRLYTALVDELDSGLHLLWLGVWSAWLGIEGWRIAATPAPVLSEHDPGHEPEPDQAATARPARDWQALGADWQARTRDAGWWRESDLTLSGLARRLGTNSLYLSRAINEGLGINFNEMVNRLRAEEVARAIEGGVGRADLLQVALAAGFRSKATFNRAFRAAYGTSPSEYRQRITS